jgi:TRAP-type C4-dicarboxylate transport system permease small subunit
MSRLLELSERWVIIPLLAFLLAFITVGVFITVVMRYAFSSSFLWGEELSIFAFIWCVFLGAGVGVRRKIHLSFDFLPNILSGRVAVFQRFLIDLSIFAGALLLLVEGWNYTVLSIDRLSPALGISLFLPTIVVPISGAYMILAVLVDLTRDVSDFIAGKSSLEPPSPGNSIV